MNTALKNLKFSKLKIGRF